ncbi:unnamed protein product [Rhodiola kirilowii]
MAKSLLVSSNFLTPQSSTSNLRNTRPRSRQQILVSCSTAIPKSTSPKQRLLALISDEERGVKTLKNATKRSEIIAAIDEITELGKGTVTTGDSLSATWRLLWTTEKEQLFIIEKAGVFGTRAGDVLQVIDVKNGVLNNVITFPPDGVFFVRSTIDVASAQRVNFRFTSAVLRGKGWEVPLPPFGQGWFETLYLDDEIRVVKDIREDYLVVERSLMTGKSDAKQSEEDKEHQQRKKRRIKAMTRRRKSQK